RTITASAAALFIVSVAVNAIAVYEFLWAKIIHVCGASSCWRQSGSDVAIDEGVANFGGETVTAQDSLGLCPRCFISSLGLRCLSRRFRRPRLLDSSAAADRVVTSVRFLDHESAYLLSFRSRGLPAHRKQQRLSHHSFDRSGRD